MPRDGVGFFVFDGVKDAGEFALGLRDLFVRAPWTDVGLPENLSLRIGLHVGPVYVCQDPVARRTTVMGGHVTRSARIEPVTPPGYVYASEAFAALAAAQGVTTFKCEYVGRTPLAKGFGTWPTYHVRQPSDPDLDAKTAN